jgi:hypothetical protein
MCGCYVSPDDAAIEREFNLVRAEWQFPASYNVAPTDDVPVVRLNKEGGRAPVLGCTGASSPTGYSPMTGPFVRPCTRPVTASQRRDFDSPHGLRPLPLLSNPACTGPKIAAKPAHRRCVPSQRSLRLVGITPMRGAAPPSVSHTSRRGRMAVKEPAHSHLG